MTGRRRRYPWRSVRPKGPAAPMARLPMEDTELGRQALAYVIALHHELAAENCAPTLGSQNQAVDFIRADPELRGAVAAWAEAANPDEATTAPRWRLPFDALYGRVRIFLEGMSPPAVFR